MYVSGTMINRGTENHGKNVTRQVTISRYVSYHEANIVIRTVHRFDL